MLMRSILSRLAKEKGNRVRAMGVLSAVEHNFNETAMHARAQVSNRLAKANRASHGPRVRAKARTKRTRENPEENPMEPKVPKVRTRAKHRKLVSQVLKTRKQRRARTLRNRDMSVPLALPGTMVGMVTNGTMAGVFDEWNDDWSSVGWHEGWEQTYDTSASPFSLGSLDVSATIGPKRFEWVNTNLDTGAAVNTFPLNFGPQGAGDGSFYRTASGEWILDGGAGFLTQENADTLPILICRDSRHGRTGATFRERKGPTAYSIPFFVGFIKDLGFRRIILNCDDEPSTKALQDAVIHACVGVEVIPQGPLEGDHMANGSVEMAVREMKRQCRTLRTSAERKHKCAYRR